MPTVGYLTLVFTNDVGNGHARIIIDEIADFATAYSFVDAVKCDVGILGAEDEEKFWQEAAS